jgi:hypothetical protein
MTWFNVCTDEVGYLRVASRTGIVEFKATYYHTYQLDLYIINSTHDHLMQLPTQMYIRIRPSTPAAARTLQTHRGCSLHQHTLIGKSRALSTRVSVIDVIPR